DNEETIYTVYTGIGYRQLDDNGANVVTSSGALGYDRESTYWYLPIGLQGAQDYGNGWRAQSQVEFEYLIGGRQRSKFGSTPGLEGLESLSNDQSDGLGFRVSIRLQKLDQWFNFIVEPYFRYWKIDDSHDSTLPSLSKRIRPKH